MNLHCYLYKSLKLKYRNKSSDLDLGKPFLYMTPKEKAAKAKVNCILSAFSKYVL